MNLVLVKWSLYSGNQQQLCSSYIIPNQWQNSPTCTEVETEPILNRQHWNLTFTSDFKTCSCNYFCAVVKCQFVHRDPMGFSRVFPLTHFLILWRNLVLTRTRSAYRAYYQLTHCTWGIYFFVFLCLTFFLLLFSPAEWVVPQVRCPERLPECPCEESGPQQLHNCLYRGSLWPR